MLKNEGKQLEAGERVAEWSSTNEVHAWTIASSQE
jgi:hypothetical protein